VNRRKAGADVYGNRGMCEGGLLRGRVRMGGREERRGRYAGEVSCHAAPNASCRSAAAACAAPSCSSKPPPWSAPPAGGSSGGGLGFAGVLGLGGGGGRGGGGPGSLLGTK